MYQFLRTAFGQGTPLRDTKYNANSPLHNFIEDIDNKRSRLFPERKRVPGRKAKYIVAIAFAIQFWSIGNTVMIKQSQSLRDKNLQKMHRKIQPFFSSLQDVEYTIVKHRYDLMFIEAFKEHGGAQFIRKHLSRYHNPKTGWAPPETNRFMLQGSGRYGRNIREEAYYRFMKTYANRNAS